jgi:diacylglycerol kinase family enzyme
MKVTLIYNPTAGDDSRPAAGQLAALIEEAGYRVRVQFTHEKDWSRALRKKAGLVAVAGGDGTVGKVARRLIDTGIPIAVLPMGTANNISKSLGIGDRPIMQLIRGWKRARRTRFDAGVASGPWGCRNFIEGVGLGVLAKTMPAMRENKTMEHLPMGEARVAYALQCLRDTLEESTPMKIKAAIDGKDVSGKYLMFEAMNKRFIGPNLFLAPHTDPGDGMLDIVFVGEKDRRKLARYLAHWQEGKAWPSNLGVGRAKRVEIEWTGFPVHLDDKVWPRNGIRRRPGSPVTIEIELRRKALQFLIPRDVATMK